MGSKAFQQAVHCLLSGQIIAYPTEAVYGLGCDPYHTPALERLLQIKERDQAQGLILIGSTFKQFGDFIRPLEPPVYKKVMRHWPGPITWLLPASANCPTLLRGDHDTIAVRLSAHSLCQALCQTCQMPLVSTSANKHGQAPARTALEVQQQLGKQIDFILDGPTSGNTQASEIWDARTNQRLR